MSVGRCSNCRFFEPLIKICRYEPPKAFPIGTPQGIQVMTVWPNPREEQGCGKYEPELTLQA